MTTFITNLDLRKETDIYFPFAYEELLCRAVGEATFTDGVVHVWRHERAFVLGLRDSRLPYAAEAMDWLEREGYRVMVRNSGGAAVPLDNGVVNVTLIRASARVSLGMYGDFEAMASLLRDSFEPIGVRFDTGKIDGSYCPGDYDLSINGRKFCGLAQRRQLKAYAVQAFVNVEGDSGGRARIVREFYRRAGGGSSSAGVLDVQADVMGSVSELHLGFPGTGVWLRHLEETLRPRKESSIDELHRPDMNDIESMMHRMKSRYDPRETSF
ncbi:lipoate--protein ligase family protein [Paenibacillus alkalitolerans]|uniref:lipoate--protein ligase family protein n=1 Tax=Paenibacillus alkalitolerans TaxID=2799335 RepID=UPI0018F2CFAF|nr:hypothetical protein [Paenibacillus alkalitolerans]